VNMRYSEEQLNSELLDQKTTSGEMARRIFICSTPRSGSYMLCRYMINAGLGVPHEYFNPIIMRQIAARLGLTQVSHLEWRRRSPRDYLPFGRAARAAEVRFLNDYLAVLVPRRCQGGIFAAKIHFDHYLKVLDNSIGYNLLGGGFFVHIYREDLLAQAVSTHFANLTGRWGIDDTITTVPALRPDFFDIAAIDRILEQLAEQDTGWRLFFNRNGLSTISISYERLCADPFGIVASIARHVGIDADALRRGYTEQASPVKNDDSLPSKYAVIQRYLARSRRI
jgi:LPS sulfotransferase NodH